MTVKFYQANTALELTDYLNDYVLTKQLRGLVYGLHNLTVILDVTTVTFSDSTGAGLNPAEIVDQINSTVAGSALLRNYGHMTAPQQHQVVFVKDAQVIDKDGTANALLGLPTAADRTVGANAVANADIIQIVSNATGSRFTVFHE